MPVIYFCKVFHFVVVPPFYCNKMVRPMYSNRDGFADGVLEQIEGMVREFLANCRWFQLCLPPSSRQSNACHEVHPLSAQVPSLWWCRNRETGQHRSDPQPRKTQRNCRRILRQIEKFRDCTERSLAKMWCLAPNCYGKFISTTKLSESVGVDWLNDGVLGAGVWVAVAKFFADMEGGFLARTGQWWNIGVERLLLRNITKMKWITHLRATHVNWLKWTLQPKSCRAKNLQQINRHCWLRHPVSAETWRVEGGKILTTQSKNKFTRIVGNIFEQFVSCIFGSRLGNSIFHWIDRSFVALRSIFPRTVDDLEEIYDLLNLHTSHKPLIQISCVLAFFKTYTCFWDENLPMPFADPWTKADEPKGPKIKAPLPGQLTSGFWPIILFLHAGCGLPSLCHGNLFWSVVHMLRGPLFCWCHNGKTRFPPQLLEMLFYASDDWNQVVRV